MQDTDGSCDNSGTKAGGLVSNESPEVLKSKVMAPSMPLSSRGGGQTFIYNTGLTAISPTNQTGGIFGGSGSVNDQQNLNANGPIMVPLGRRIS